MTKGLGVIDQNGRIHNQVVELLSAYIDDEVSADERATVEAHLATCSACAQDLASLRQTVNLLGELPQVAAPRPFTVRESDIRPVPGPDRPAWWRLRWAQGLVGAAAMLLCVVVVGVVLLGRGGMMGAPSEQQRVALEAAPATVAGREEKAVEEAVEAETIVEAEREVQSAAEPAAAPPAPEAATGELGLAEEAPAEAPLLEEKAAADEAEIFMATSPPDRRMADEGALMTSPLPSATPAATATPAPMATTAPAPAAEAIPAPSASPTPTLLEAEDLNLEIEAGVIRVRGRLPLPEGRKLLAGLWRDGEPIEWATIESQQFVAETDGQFYLVLVAKAEIPDFDLFAAEPADYEIRIRPVDPPAPVEIRIPFDTWSPPAPPPTNEP